MKSPIKIALSWFSRKFQEITGELPKAIQEELNNEVSPQKAVNEGFKKQGIFGKLRQRITEVIEKAAEIGFGKKPPKMPELFEAWDSSKMNLSEKLHGANIEMRKSIVNTIREQLKLGNKAQKSALALYDGYNSGKRVIRKQELPIYMQNIVNFARRGDLSDKDKEVLQRLIRNARRQVEHLGENGAPNKALKAAYSELLQAVEDGKTKALERGIRTAVEEKSRYVAERIARTEAARAWADAFIARYENDKDVVAYKWQLGSRHPHFDICDMYANANLYGLGAGIFPKDKCPPLPVHPHCLCHLSPIFKSEIDITKQKDRLKEGGAEWLKSLTNAERVKLLGVDGARAFKNDEGDFLLSLRGFTNEVMGTRLKNVVTDEVNSGKINAMDKQIINSHKKFVVEDVTQKYLLEVAPHSGFVSIPDGYNQNLHKDEIFIAKWLFENIGGILILLNEKNEQNQKTADYVWNDKLWDLKSISTEKAADSAIRHGLKQIAENPGGLILDYKGEELNNEKLVDVIEDRLSRGFTGTIDILVLNSGNIQFVKRYKKR